MIFVPFFGDYEIANLFRIGGPGLGNLLFPLCRSYVYSVEFNGELMPPIWPSLKLGAILRGEKEKRGYADIFNSTFFERTFLTLKNILNTAISEEEFLNNPSNYHKYSNTTVKVRGLKNYFNDLENYSSVLLDYILTIASAKVKNTYDNYDQQNIGVHIRLGDYNEDGRTPLEWYVNVIESLQNEKDYTNTKFIIFSDGTDKELESIISISNCVRTPDPNALSDILCLSKSQIIIGSNSTFSAWSAFFGKKPFIRHEKFYIGNIYKGTSNEFEGHKVQDFLKLQH